MKRHDEKREQRKRLFMSLFIVAILVFSAAGYMVGRGSETTKYNDFKFSRKNNNWVTRVDSVEINFDYFPDQVESINISNEIIDRIKNSREIDVTSEFNSSFKEAIALSQFKLGSEMSKINVYLIRGFTTDTESDIPIITCENATNFVPVVLFEKYNETKIYEDGNCIIIKAKSELDFIAIKDRILYSVFDIIK